MKTSCKRKGASGSVTLRQLRFPKLLKEGGRRPRSEPAKKKRGMKVAGIDSQCISERCGGLENDRLYRRGGARRSVANALAADLRMRKGLFV
jgi:hypothetical protein